MDAPGAGDDMRGQAYLPLSAKPLILRADNIADIISRSPYSIPSAKKWQCSLTKFTVIIKVTDEAELEE